MSWGSAIYSRKDAREISVCVIIEKLIQSLRKLREKTSSVHRSDAFMPQEQEWIKSHYLDVIKQVVEFSECPLDGKEILDVGCGDCIIDYGFLNLPINKITGLDVVSDKNKRLSSLPQRIRDAGYSPPVDLSRFEHVAYDGSTFPFPDESFDVVFSWSAFEHIGEVKQILSEIKRVVRTDGFALIQVYPWFHTRHGSHLTDHIKDPFFHLKLTADEVRVQLEQKAERHPDSKQFILGHLWGEYTTLNHFSADIFYEIVKEVGLVAKKVQLISFCDDLSQAPVQYKLSELMIMGSIMLLKKASSR